MSNQDRVQCKEGEQHKWVEQIVPLIAPDGSSVPHIQCRRHICEKCGCPAVKNGVTGQLEAPHTAIMGVKK